MFKRRNTLELKYEVLLEQSNRDKQRIIELQDQNNHAMLEIQKLKFEIKDMKAGKR